MKSPIYLITTLTKLEPDDKFIADLGHTRAVAFYYDFNDAELSVVLNNCDMWETIYDYACIEEVDEGMYPAGMKRWFYKYNKETGLYERINEPDFMKHLTNLSIG